MLWEFNINKAAKQSEWTGKNKMLWLF